MLMEAFNILCTIENYYLISIFFFEQRIISRKKTTTNSRDDALCSSCTIKFFYSKIYSFLLNLFPSSFYPFYSFSSVDVRVVQWLANLNEKSSSNPLWFIRFNYLGKL